MARGRTASFWQKVFSTFPEFEMAKHDKKITVAPAAAVPAGGKHTLTTEVPAGAIEKPAEPIPEPIPDEVEGALAVPEEKALATFDPATLLSVEDAAGARAEERGFKGGVPYVGHYGEKAKKPTREPLDAMGVKVGEFYLFFAGSPIRLESDNRRATLHLLRYTRLFTKQDQSMNITGVKLVGTRATFDEGYREHLFCLVAVRLPEFDEAGRVTGRAAGFIPASLTLRGGQAQAMENTIRLLKVAEQPVAWSALSPAHKASVTAKHPGGRIVTQIWSTSEPLDDGSGNTFNKGHGVCRPTLAEDAVNFNAWYDNSLPQITAVAAALAGRVDEAKKKLVV